MSMFPQRYAALFSSAAFLMLLSGCPESTSSDPQQTEDMPTMEVDMVEDMPKEDMEKMDMPVFTALVLDKAALTLQPGDSDTLKAFLVTADNQQVPRSVLWETSDRNVALVTNGEVIARRAGNATITATLDGFTATCDVTVGGGFDVSRAEIVPSSRTLPVNSTFQFFATFYTADDQRVTVTEPIVWSSSDTQVATVDTDTGNVTTLAEGQTTIEVAYKTVKASAQLTVSADAPQLSRIQVLPTLSLTRTRTSTLMPVAFNDQDMEVADPGFQFISSAPDVASVDMTSGVVTANKVGQAKITISAGAIQANVDVEVTFDIDALAVGRAHACVLVDGDMYCWGANANGQLGQGSKTANAAPAKVQTPVGVLWQSISAGGNTTCAITTQDKLYCWGQSNYGQVGDNNMTDRETPQAIGGQTTFELVRVGSTHACALDTGDHFWCWGDNRRGQLGDGTSTSVAVPKRDVLDRRWTLLAAGGNHTCVVDAAQDAWCWGANTNGQLGLTGTTDASSPSKVLGGLKFVQIDLGQNHSCGITMSGTPTCWGANAQGQLGERSMIDRDVPIFLSSSVRMLNISAGEAHSCAYVVGGEIYCWGDGRDGQLGNGQKTTSTSPVKTSSSEVIIATDTGEAFSCGLGQNGSVYCWGAGDEGQLGTQSTSSTTPVKVGGL